MPKPPDSVKSRRPKHSSFQLFSSIQALFSTTLASGPSNILVRGNKIEKISPDPIPTDRRADTVIKMATSTNAEILTLSGKRNSYPGKLGVVEEGALADLLLVDCDLLDDIKLVAEPEKKFCRSHEGREGLQELAEIAAPGYCILQSPIPSNGDSAIPTLFPLTRDPTGGCIRLVAQLLR